MHGRCLLRGRPAALVMKPARWGRIVQGFFYVIDKHMFSFFPGQFGYGAEYWKVKSFRYVESELADSGCHSDLVVCP